MHIQPDSVPRAVAHSNPFLILLRGRRAHGVTVLADHCRHRLVHGLSGGARLQRRAAGGICTNHAGVHVSHYIRYISVHDRARAVAAVVRVIMRRKNINDHR